MIIISKPLFYRFITPELNCKNLIHPWTSSCVKSNFGIVLRCFRGIFYFYLPIYLLKLLLDYRAIDKKYVKKIIRDYIKSWSYGASFAGLVVSSLCISSNFLGGLYYYGVGFMPGFISGLSLLFEQPVNRSLNMLIWMSMVIEAIFNNVYYFKLIQFSKTKETVMFMLVSSLLMHLLVHSKKKIPLNIWFHTPHIRTDLNQHCSHDTTNIGIPCLHYCFKEFLKYFSFGYALNTSRSFISMAGKIVQKPLTLIDLIINKNNFKFGMVLGTYAGIFRMVMCLLFKYNNKGKDSLNAALAGFLAGSAYYIKPTLNILAIAVVTVLQIICTLFIKIPKSFDKVPFTIILYMFCNGILFHNRLMGLPTCPKYYTKMLNIASNGVVTEIYSEIIKIFLFD